MTRTRDGTGGPTDRTAAIITDTDHRRDRLARQCNGLQTQLLRRRRAASYRLQRLDCGCRDPWGCRCHEPPTSEQGLDAWAAAARHIMDATGCAPVVPPDMLRALWRRGGSDRELAQHVYDLAGGA